MYVGCNKKEKGHTHITFGQTFKVVQMFLVEL